MILEIGMVLLFVVLGIGALLPVYWTWKLIVDYHRRTVITPPIVEPCPNVAVILCLRGADPSLDACLRGLLQQDYPRYQVHIVVDNSDDSAWNNVRNILAIGTRPGVEVRVDVLEKHCPACSLKVCAQLQAISRLAPDTQAVVLIDADSIPASDWLRAMIAPFADPTVGATTGVRWFAPVDGGWGSLVRYIYNAGSYPQMFAFDHAWGGSLGIRADVLHQSRLKQRWCQALCEDSAVTGPLREMGLKMIFVPAATNTNMESISFQASLHFVQRQLLCVRLDHVHWPKLLAANMINAVALGSLVILCGVSVYWQRWDWTGIAAGLLASVVISVFGGLVAAEFAIRRNYRLRGFAAPPWAWSWRMLPAFLFTQMICMRYLWRARNLQQVGWRGIQYAIQGPGQIRMKQYAPYQSPKETSPQHSTV